MGVLPMVVIIIYITQTHREKGRSVQDLSSNNSNINTHKCNKNMNMRNEKLMNRL